MSFPHFPQTPTFESLIAELPADTQADLRIEFQRLTESGRRILNHLLALAYGQGHMDRVAHVQAVFNEQKEKMRSLGL